MPPGAKTDAPLETKPFRDFAGMNLTDNRTAIEDKEFFWLENAMPIGKGNIKLTPASSDELVSVAAGIASIWGVTLHFNAIENPVLLTINLDGSATQIMPEVAGGSGQTICVAGTLTTAARLAMWADSIALIVDPTKGYFGWDGMVFTTFSAARVARDIAVFEGRAWLLTATRTITFTAPNSFTDFTAGNGGGSTTIADAAFPGQITRLLSALEQLWIVGPAAVDAISNVQTAGTPLVTTFSITNVVSNVGTIFPSSVTSFFRTFLFMSHYGVYAIVGATPQKLSDKLDGIFPRIRFGDDIDAAVFSIYDVFVWAAQVKILDPFTRTERTILFCFSQGKWFFADPGVVVETPGTEMRMTGLVNSAGDPELWISNGTDVYRAFGDTSLEEPVSYRIMTKLWDFGLFTQMKEWTRLALEITSDNVVDVTYQTENENQALPDVTIQAANEIIFVGTAPITFIGSAAITWVGAGLQILTNKVGMIGRYFGLTLVGESPPFQLSGMALQIKGGGDWNR